MFGVVVSKGATARLFDEHLILFFGHWSYGVLMDLMMKVNAFTMQIANKETLKRAPLTLPVPDGINICIIASIGFR